MPVTLFIQRTVMVCAESVLDCYRERFGEVEVGKVPPNKVTSIKSVLAVDLKQLPTRATQFIKVSYAACAMIKTGFGQYNFQVEVPLAVGNYELGSSAQLS